jgi:hypothetical protein
LWRTPQGVAELDLLAEDRDRAGRVEADVAPPERHQLGWARSRAERRDQEDPQVRRGGLDEALRLL